MSKKKQTEEALPIEANINKLQSIIELIEEDSTALEDSLRLFEEGINLTRQVQKTLSEAEQKVSKLIETDNILLTEDFTPQAN
jgi:exodeoxyribonuclease VII small subunit